MEKQVLRVAKATDGLRLARAIVMYVCVWGPWDRDEHGVPRYRCPRCHNPLSCGEVADRRCPVCSFQAEEQPLSVHAIGFACEQIAAGALHDASGRVTAEFPGWALTWERSAFSKVLVDDAGLERPTTVVEFAVRRLKVEAGRALGGS